MIWLSIQQVYCEPKDWKHTKYHQYLASHSDEALSLLLDETNHGLAESYIF